MYDGLQSSGAEASSEPIVLKRHPFHIFNFSRTTRWILTNFIVGMEYSGDLHVQELLFFGQMYLEVDPGQAKVGCRGGFLCQTS